MQHRGEIVEQAVRNSGYSITKLANKLGKSRRWLYLTFENPNLSLDHILEIGRLINYDFSGEIDEFKQISSHSVFEPGNEYVPDERSVSYWKNKYFELLEEYHQLLKNIKID
ncbi:MAG: hypothetical protein EP338_07250 [Bacteroidetes bacterium]|nr:MAG: hypothetical protein EP338_07250 [Bacteroidota bacterium]